MRMIKIGKCEKIGLVIMAVAFICMMIMVMANQMISDVVMYIFMSGLIITFVGSIFRIRKNKKRI